MTGSSAATLASSTLISASTEYAETLRRTAGGRLSCPRRSCSGHRHEHGGHLVLARRQVRLARGLRDVDAPVGLDRELRREDPRLPLRIDVDGRRAAGIGPSLERVRGGDPTFQLPPNAVLTGDGVMNDDLRPLRGCRCGPSVSCSPRDARTASRGRACVRRRIARCAHVGRLPRRVAGARRRTICTIISASSPAATTPAAMGTQSGSGQAVARLRGRRGAGAAVDVDALRRGPAAV